MKSLDMGRLTLGAACVGGAQASLEACVHWAKTREQFGQELAHTLDYAGSLAQTLHHLLAALAGYRRCRHRADENLARTVRQHLERSQAAWSQHQRCANLRGTASAFRSDNLWTVTQRVLDELRPAAPTVTS